MGVSIVLASPRLLVRGQVRRGRGVLLSSVSLLALLSIIYNTLDTGHLHAGHSATGHYLTSANHNSAPRQGSLHCLLLTNSHARPGHYGALRPPRLAGGPRHGQLRGRRALRHPRTRAQCECSLCCRATCHLSRVTPPQAGRVEPCTRAMFGNKSAVALLACEAQFALQRNWYPDPIQVAAAWLP